MPKFTTFDEQVPIIRDQPVSSRAEGMENISKAFGMAEEAFAKKAADLGDEQSNVMMLQTQAHADTIKTNANIEIIKNPAQTKQIIERAGEDYESTVQEALVNNADRSKLQYLAAKDFNDLRLAGAKSEIAQAKKQSQVAFFSNWSTVLQGVKDSANDEKAFNIRVDSAKQSIDSMLIAGSITPKQAGSFYQTLGGVVTATHEFYKRFSEGDVSAKDYNRQNAKTTYVDNESHVNAPVDQGTAHLSANQTQDVTVEGAKSSIAQGNKPNASAWASIHSPEKLNELSNYTDGASSVDADFSLTSIPFNQLTSELKDLESTSKLSPWQQGRKDRLNNVMTHLNNGLYYKLIAKNTMYQGAIGDYNHTISAIQKDANLSSAEKNNQVQYADNKLAYTAAAIGDAQHVPDKLIRPIPLNFIQNGQRAFDTDGDPQLLKTSINYFSHNLREYYARGLETPLQRETARTVGQLSGAAVHDSNINSLILANQKGRDYSAIKVDHDVIKERLYKSTNNVMQFIGRQPGGSERVAALADMGTNYIKQAALAHGDVNMVNIKQYSDEASDLINKAYPITKGVTWDLNPNDFHGLSKPQMDHVSNYLIDYAYEHILGLDVNKVSMSARMDRINLHVVGAPTGKFIVQDAHGNPVMTERYSSNLIAAANHHVESKVSKMKTDQAAIAIRDLHD